jgi:N-acyl-D-aspartate/D-glutamate deacylase
VWGGLFRPVPTADNCLAPFLATLDVLRKTPNIGSFIGQGSVRSAVIGDVNRAASPAEMMRVTGLVEQGMKDGAFGLSTGLFYVPGTLTRRPKSSSWRASRAGSGAATSPISATTPPECSRA